jgi:hypothetical protein
MIRVNAPPLQRPLSALVDALRAKQDAIRKARQRLHAVTIGG